MTFAFARHSGESRNPFSLLSLALHPDILSPERGRYGRRHIYPPHPFRIRAWRSLPRVGIKCENESKNHKMDSGFRRNDGGFPHRGTFSSAPKRADTPVRPYGKRVVQTRKLSLPGRETTKPCGIHPASLSPRRIPFCPEADLALSFISRERPSTGNNQAFPRICRHRVSGGMRENPRAESECSHCRGEEENGTGDSDSTPAPRSECSAGANAPPREGISEK